MKNLLLISNISSENHQLVEYAARFCKHYGSKLHVLHVADNSSAVLVSSPRYYKAFDIQFKNDKPKKITQEITKITSKLLDREFVQVKIEAGNQQKILANFINENFIDMIVIGNHDLENVSSIKEHKNILMNVISTPLLVVPEYQVFEPLKRLNFLTTHTKQDLNNIVKLAEIFPKSKIKLTHLEGKVEIEEKQKAQKWVNYVQEKAGRNIEYENVDQDLRQHIKNENYAEDKRFEGFVFTSFKRNFWSRLFEPSTTLSFLTSLEIPAIIFKIKENDV